MSRLACFSQLLFGVIALAAFGGCADPYKNREEITGEVKLKGQPVADGIISFVPLDSQPTGDGAKIVHGKYRIPKDKGLAPGRYRVALIAGNGISGAGDASPDSPNAGHRLPKELIPPEYNEKSKVVKEVKKSGPNKFDFDIP